MLNSRVSTRPFLGSALLALLVMLLVGVGFRPKPTLAAPTADLLTQDFESGEAINYAASPPAYNESSGSDIWEISTGVGTITSAASGSQFWGIRDINNGGSGGNFDHTLTFPATGSIDTSALSNVQVAFDFNAVGFDTGDRLTYELIYNTGSQGDTNVVTGASGGVSTSGWETETISVPNSVTSVQLVLKARQDGDTDYAGFDNIAITGDPAADVPPQVASTSPTNTATDVPQSSTITINFSESVTIAAGAFSLECPSGTPTAFTVSPTLPTSGVSAVVLTPDSVLPSSTTCTVTAIATNITDEGGNNNQLDGNGDGTGGDNHVFTFTTAAPQTTWAVEIDFSEPVFQVLGASTTPLADGFTQEFDIVAPTNSVRCDGNPLTLYTEGQDGVTDLRLTVSVTDGSGGRWDQIRADWSPGGTPDFRSNWRINSSDTSQPNDYGLITFDFEFINGVQNSIAANDTDIRVTSTNGSSEAYEWAFVTANGTIVPVASIGAYSNVIYSDVSGSSNIDAGGNWIGAKGELTSMDPPPAPSAELPNNSTMAEHLTSPGGAYSKGGLVNTGWWAIDDHNTDIFDALEQESFNPDAGDGATDDDQTVTGALFGLAGATLVDQLTVYFGLVDVAFNTNPSTDATTKTNTLPSAGVEFFNIGYDTSTLCTTAIVLENFTADMAAGDTVDIRWQTAAEVDHAGFNVYRSSSEEFNRTSATQLNAELIAAQGSFGQGASYSLIDEAVPAGVWYYYLEDVDLYGVSTLHDPVRVDTSRPTSTTLTTIGGGSALPLLPAIVVLTMGVLLVAFRATLGTIWTSFAGIIVRKDRS